MQTLQGGISARSPTKAPSRNADALTINLTLMPKAPHKPFNSSPYKLSLKPPQRFSGDPFRPSYNPTMTELPNSQGGCCLQQGSKFGASASSALTLEFWAQSLKKTEPEKPKRQQATRNPPTVCRDTQALRPSGDKPAGAFREHCSLRRLPACVAITVLETLGFGV